MAKTNRTATLYGLGRKLEEDNKYKDIALVVSDSDIVRNFNMSRELCYVGLFPRAPKLETLAVINFESKKTPKELINDFQARYEGVPVLDPQLAERLAERTGAYMLTYNSIMESFINAAMLREFTPERRVIE